MTTTILLARVALSAAAMTLAALAAERALRDVGRQARAVWALALGLSAAATLLIVTGGRLPLAAPSFVSAWFAPAPAYVRYEVARESVEAAAVDPWLAIWLSLSLASAGALAFALMRQRVRLRTARPERVSGVDVIVTRALGPAVFGFLHPRIVVPDWLLDRPEAERRLVVLHEAEHIAARDPLLAVAAIVVVCLMPWNPFLWYQLRRLRLAIELDCDARVLRRGDARAYGLLLVDVADRLARGAPLATALAFPRNFLDRRIRMIVNRRTRPLRAAALTLAAGAFVVAACADAADPTASEPTPMSAEAPRVAGEPLETIGFVAVDADGDGEVVLAPTPADDHLIVIDSALSSEGYPSIVPYRGEVDGGQTRARVPAPEGAEIVPTFERRLPARQPLRLRVEDLRATENDAATDEE